MSLCNHVPHFCVEKRNHNTTTQDLQGSVVRTVTVTLALEQLRQWKGTFRPYYHHAAAPRNL